MAEVKSVARFPEFYEYKESSHSRHRSQDIGELGTDEIRNKELRPAKCDPAYSRGRQYGAQARPAERHTHHLKTAVVGEMTDGVFQRIKFAALLHHAIEQNRGEHDPADGKESKCRPE